MIYGIIGKKQSGKNTVAKIWQLLDVWYNQEYYNKEKFPEFKGDENFFIKMFLDEPEWRSFTWIQKSFAHKLKQILCILTGCTMEQLEDEEFKNSKLPEEWKVWKVLANCGDNVEIFLYSTEEGAKQDIEKSKIDTESPLYLYFDFHVVEYLPTYREALQYIGTDLFRNQFHPQWAINALFSEYYSTEAVITENPVYPNWLITDIRFQNEADAVTVRDGKLIKVEKITKEKSSVDTHQSETELEYIKTDYYISVHQGDIESLVSSVKRIMIEEGVIK